MRALVLCASLLLAVASPARAHAIHTTLTVVTLDPGSRSATVSIRAFADDFSAAVARAAGKPVPRDSSAAPDDVAAYVRARLVIDGATLVPCGVRRAGDVFLLCFRVTLPAGRVRARNRLLMEWHADQVNIVQLRDGDRQRTHLFTRSAAEGALDGR